MVIVIAIAVYYSGNEVHGKPPDGASPNKEDGQNYECLENSRLVQQVNLCQKLLFMYQLTHNMTKDFSLNSKKNTTCCAQILFWMSKQKPISVHNKL